MILFQVVEVVASALQDLMCAEFHAFRTADRLLQLPTKDANMLHWEQQTYLASGSLLAKSCQSAMMLAGHSEERQEQAFKFGKYMAYTYQVIGLCLNSVYCLRLVYFLVVDCNFQEITA